MLLCNIVHEVNKISILGESLMLDQNETRTKINFYITRTEYRRFKDTCKNQDISMSVLLRSMIKKVNKTAEVDLI
jgi:hypothetical protein